MAERIMKAGLGFGMAYYKKQEGRKKKGGIVV